jgi:hypothetical protein
MKVDRGFLAIVAVSCVGLVVPRTAAADGWNKQTVLTFSQDVEIPGKVLPAGKYVFRLMDSASNRHVVQVFDDAGRILATVLTIPAARLTAADDTRITFEEQPAGAPFSIKNWFYPGDLDGEEFIYPTPTN